METKSSQREINVDVIRVIAMLMVVYMHTVYNFSLRIDFFATKLWFLLEPFTIFSKTCVLLFFMVSGYLVIGRKRSIAENWTKTKQRILIPLVFFEMVNIAYAAYLYHFDQGAGIFWQGQVTRLIGYPSSPLWFLVVLFFLYMLNPVWQMIFTKENRALAIYCTKAAFALSVVLMIGAFMSHKIEVIFNLFTSWIGFVSMYLYGGLVARGWVKYSDRKANVFLGTSSFVLIFLGDYLTGWHEINRQAYVLANYTGNFLSLPILILAVVLFNMLISTSWKTANTVLKKNVSWLASLSYGIYLLHTYVVSFLTDIISFNFDQISMNVYVYISCSFVIVLGVSTILSLIVKKLPFVRQVIGEPA